MALRLPGGHLLRRVLPGRVGLLGQALLPLAAGTAVVVALGTLMGYQLSAKQSRTAALQDIERESDDRSKHEQAIFSRIRRQVVLARDLLARRLDHGGQPTSNIPLDKDGARRLFRGATGSQVAAFISANSWHDPSQYHTVGVAFDLIDEVGPTLTGDDADNLSIAVPGHWLVGWGSHPVELAKTMLPNDPILLPDERHMLDSSEEVSWSQAFYEPAADEWLVTAGTGMTLPSGERALVTQVLSCEKIQADVMRNLVPSSQTIVVDDQDRLLADSQHFDLLRAHHEPPTLAGNASACFAHLRDHVPVHGEPAERISAPNGWYGVSRIAGPDWTIVTFYPSEMLQSRARATAMSIVMVGGVVLAAQAVLLLMVLRMRIEKPLRRLTEAAGALAAGTSGPALETARADELGELSNAFAAMSAAVVEREEELRRTLEALRSREELARALVSGAADAVVVIDGGMIASVNPRAELLYGAASGTLVGARLDHLAPPNQPDGINSLASWRRHENAVLSGETQHFAWRGRRLDNSEFDSEIGLTQIMLPGRSCLLAMVRDTTQRNQLEQQLRQSQKMDSLGQLAGGVAHDYNNMLTGIMGSADLLLSRHGDGPAGKHLRLILKASERAAELTRKLLTFARMGRGMLTQVDLHQVVHDTVTMLEHTIDKRISIRVALTAPHSIVTGDAAQLQSALLNLAVNARDAMPEGGELVFASAERTLSAREIPLLAIALEPGTYFELAVSDTGTGIPPELVARIFEPFFTTKPIGKGTGLGLAAVFGTMRDHHGSVAVESELGHGTTFRLFLQLTDAQKSGPRAIPRALPPPGEGAVLIIDDEDIAREAARGMLEQLGYEPLCAGDAHSGLAVFAEQRERIRAVLIDMEMPHLRGIDCLRQLQVLAPGVRAILCSGFARDSTPEQLSAEGFRAQLTKPYLLDELHRTLDEVINGP